ncbi:MAG: hypothetical protein ACXW2E_01795 [Nitrososphaeraceae archaeon]
MITPNQLKTLLKPELLETEIDAELRKVYILTQTSGEIYEINVSHLRNWHRKSWDKIKSKYSKCWKITELQNSDIIHRIQFEVLPAEEPVSATYFPEDK